MRAGRSFFASNKAKMISITELLNSHFPSGDLIFFFNTLLVRSDFSDALEHNKKKYTGWDESAIRPQNEVDWSDH